MLEYGFSRRAICWNALRFVLWSGVFCPEFCIAQQPNQLVPPAPLGTPQVGVGPAANPFGPPPMAIGPAPAPGFFGPAPGPFVFGPPIAQPFGYPPPGYPGAPYMVRRATPFGATGPGPVLV